MFVRAALVAGLLLAVSAGTNLAEFSAAAEPSCATGDAALERADPAAARDAYLAVLKGEPKSTCAVTGLGEVTATIDAEKALCAEAKVLGAEGDAEGAKSKYVDALKMNADSECAEKGLAPPEPEDGEEKTGAEKYESNLKAVFASIGLWITAGLVGFGTAAILIFAFLRRRRASLAIEPFGDGGVEAKVGAVVAGLVRKRLSELSARTSQSSGSIRLDFVVADVELLAENDNLEKALGGLAEVSQLKFVVALLGLIDRNSSRRMVAKGDLAAPGTDGCGVVLGLQSGSKGVQASGAIWDGSTAEGDQKPGPYYALAERAAAWLQYETARGLDAKVGHMTRNAQSFSLLAEGLSRQRSGEDEKAAGFYAEALENDPENVAALVNLGMIMARVYGDYDAAIGLLGLARTALFARYEEKKE